MKFNIFVDDKRDTNSNEGEVPTGHEHDGDAEDGPEDGQGPVVILEAWPPVGGLQQGQEGAGYIDETVAHQEEHTGNNDNVTPVTLIEQPQEELIPNNQVIFVPL